MLLVAFFDASFRHQLTQRADRHGHPLCATEAARMPRFQQMWLKRQHTIVAARLQVSEQLGQLSFAFTPATVTLDRSSPPAGIKASLM